jgi:hypothetical protein
VLKVFHCDHRHVRIIGHDGAQNPANMVLEFSFCTDLVRAYHGNDTVYARKENVAMRVEERGLNLTIDLGVFKLAHLEIWLNWLGEKHVMPASQDTTNMPILRHFGPTIQYAEEALSVSLDADFAIRAALDLPILRVRVMTAVESADLGDAFVARTLFRCLERCCIGLDEFLKVARMFCDSLPVHWSWETLNIMSQHLTNNEVHVLAALLSLIVAGKLWVEFGI